MLNQKVLMSGADYFSVKELNPYSNQSVQPLVEAAKSEHGEVKSALESAGVEVVEIDAPADCQDGVYTANWAFIHGGKAVMASLPSARQAEEPYAAKTLSKLRFDMITPPYRFSGQGDTLICGKYLFCGSGYRTDKRMHAFLADTFPELEVISLQAVPELDEYNEPVTNQLTGWPDSYFYDLDLALAVLKDDLIAYCPEAFLPESRQVLSELPINKIEVSLEEAKTGFACNLVSTGETVIMSAHSPQLQADIEAQGLKTVTIEAPELLKGGGFIRCTSLTLDS